MNYAPVFYPGTPDLASAVPIALAAGEEHADVDIALQLISTAKISGTVTVPQGVRPETVRLGLASGGPVLPLGINPVFSGGISAGKDGAFTFTGVAPGHYTITAQASSLPPGAAPPMPPGDNGVQRFYAQADVTVAGQDAIVPLTLQPAMTLSGRVAFEDGPPPTASSGFRIMLLPPNSNGQLLSPTMNAAGDRFDFFGILPGRYRVTYSTPPGNTWFLKSAIAHGQETLDGPLEIRPGDDISDWVVTLTNRPSELAGTLTDASGRAAPDYFIIVFPTDKQYWTAGPRRVRQLRPGMDGKFSVQGLPAGEYFIAALTDVEPNEFYAPSFLEPLVSSAAKVTITDGQKTVQDLRISGHR